MQDINRLRLDEGYLEALGGERLPAPSTAGDFLRRFEASDLVDLQEAINQARQPVWLFTTPLPKSGKKIGI